MFDKTKNRPFTKRLDCECNRYNDRAKSSRRYGVFRVWVNGYFRQNVEVRQCLTLKCISCGRKQKIKIRVREKKWKLKKQPDMTEQKKRLL